MVQAIEYHVYSVVPPFFLGTIQTKPLSLQLAYRSGFPNTRIHSTENVDKRRFYPHIDASNDLAHGFVAVDDQTLSVSP